MTLPVSFLIGSTIALVIMTGVFRLEDRAGRLLVLSAVRQWFNECVEGVYKRITGWHPYAGRGFVRLMLHYLVHTLLKRVLRLVRRVEQWIERVMRQNRQVAKSIDAGNRPQTHLEAIAEHKVETALTEREKRRLRAKL